MKLLNTSLGVRDGEQLHDGRVYPYFAGHRNCGGIGQDHPVAKNLVVHGGPETQRRTFMPSYSVALSPYEVSLTNSFFL